MFRWFNPYGYPDFFNLNWILPLVVLDIILKGITLWRAARNSQKGWFVVLLIVNSAGILPMIYLLFFDKKKKK